MPNTRSTLVLCGEHNNNCYIKYHKLALWNGPRARSQKVSKINVQIFSDFIK